ncbi:MAG: phoD [Myxococcaceae bacterium]|nr:phoD [Myxococcaceae bacterium]
MAAEDDTGAARAAGVAIAALVCGIVAGTMLTRRDLLAGVGASVALGTVAAGCEDTAATPAAADAGFTPVDAPAAPYDSGPPVDGGPAVAAVDFLHGVASGDPLPDRVMLWTRVTPRMGADGTAVVRWETSTTPDFAAVVTSGTFNTAASRDYTVKVDVGGLSPATTYYYRFSVGETRSPVGRTRTAPAGTVERLRFAVVSCSSLAHGYFHAYRDVAERADLDAVLHLGDYIYEFQNNLYGGVRPYDPPTSAVTLSDYRRRHAWYKRDADLRAAHQQHPFIAIWDDHEFANNAWRDGADNHLPETEGLWSTRKAAAMQAYFEWMPIRELDNGRIWRRFAFGNLIDLSLLDTRIWGRSMQEAEVSNDPSRMLLGADQEQWLLANLASSTARWKVIGQQVQVGAIRPDLNLDGWEGYPVARTRLLRALATMRSSNVAVLTGDIHSSWAMDIAVDPFSAGSYNAATGQGSLGVEFITPAITSPGDHPNADVAPLLAQNPHLRYGNPGLRGFMILDCTHERLQAAWFHLPAGSIEQRERQRTAFSAAWSTLQGANRLSPGGEPAAPRDNPPALAPWETA